MKYIVGTEAFEENYRLADAKRRKRNFQWLVAIFALLIVVCAAIGITMNLTNKSSAKDSGISACQQMASNVSTKKTSGPMTVEQRDQKKAIFKNSHYSDLQVAGSNVVDTVYAMAQNPDGSLVRTLANLTELESQWESLQEACLNHGIQIPGI